MKFDLSGWSDEQLAGLARAWAADLRSSVRLVGAEGPMRPPDSLPSLLDELVDRFQKRAAERPFNRFDV